MSHSEDHLLHQTLSAYLDGETTAAESQAVERHLPGCAGCRDRLEDLRTLAAATAGEEVPPLPGDLLARIGQRLDAESSRSPGAAVPPGAGRRRLTPWLWRGGPLAAAASLMGAAILWRIWMAGPAPVAPFKAIQGPPPAVQESVPADQDRRVPARAKDDQEGMPEPALEESAGAVAAPPPLQVDGAGRASALSRDEKKERRKAAREQAPQQDALQSGAASHFSVANQPADERQRTDDALADMPAAGPPPSRFLLEENGVRVELTPDGELQVAAPGYSCRVSVAMPELELPSAQDDQAVRVMLLRLVRERYRDQLEETCGTLPPRLPELPQN